MRSSCACRLEWSNGQVDEGLATSAACGENVCSIAVPHAMPRSRVPRREVGASRVARNRGDATLWCDRRRDLERRDDDSPYPKHPQLSGNYAPLRMECDLHDLVVEGEIPRELAGTYYRNGPDPQYPPRGEHHWFAGDGMVHAWRIEDGRVSYRNRWVAYEEVATRACGEVAR